MTDFKFTAGGWGRNIPPADKYPIIYAGRNTHVAQVITRGIPSEEAEANADLIAAAPLLAEALAPFAALLHENSADSHASCYPDSQPIFAINKATITLGDLRKARNALAMAVKP